jgi:L-alanine-DL-glutamate epimerase-like enolase superfamily enzyme
MKISYQRHLMRRIYPLVISRGCSGDPENLYVKLHCFGSSGLGELAGTKDADGENCDSGIRELDAFVAGLEEDAQPSIHDIWQRARAAGVRPRALAALDMALWDAFAKACGEPLWRLFGLARRAVPTSLTIGINPPEITRERVPEILARTGAKSLKIKLGSPQGLDADQAHFLAARDAAKPFNVHLRVDANGGWTCADAKIMLPWLAARDVSYVEQPLVKGAEDQLPELFKSRPMPIFVDESCCFASDVPALAHCVDGVNLKLMKCGGLSEALRIVAAARAHGLQTMIGCMSESTVSISAGASISALFDHIDLDSHFNISNDPARGAEMIDGAVIPPDRPGHGAYLK